MKEILKYIKLGLFGGMILGLASCTDLDEIVFDAIPAERYPENPDQVAGISVQAYTYLRPLVDDEGWWFLAQEISSDEFCGPTRDTDWDDGGKWRVMHQHNWTNDVEAVNRMWEKLFEGTSRSNQIIERMKLLPKNEEIDKKIKEVEVVRSFYYYLLMDNYGDIPYLTIAASAPEKPFKINRAAVFDSLVYTLESSLPYLKAVNLKTMATRYMAYALLAKLYLNAEVYTGTPQWEKAGMYCDSIIAGPYSLESNVSAPFVTNNENSTENIFTIPYDEDDFKGFRLHMRTLHYQHNLKFDMPVGPWNGLSATFDHFNTYEDADARKSAYFIYGPQLDSKGSPIIDAAAQQPLVINPFIPALRMTSANSQVEIKMSGARVGKFEIRKGAFENLSNDFPLFRLTDIYLMKAETEIRLGRNGDEWINPIRRRAGVAEWSNASLTDLLAERGRELFCEGHRRQDLIRFNQFTRSWWAKGDAQGGVAGDPSVNIFPIPKWATDANDNLLKAPMNQ